LNHARTAVHAAVGIFDHGIDSFKWPPSDEPALS